MEECNTVLSGPKIFLSYRRIDTEPWAGRLFGKLWAKFPFLVFMDIKDGIRRGENFEQELIRALENSDILLVLIGPQWLTCTRSNGARRLDVPEDWVRREIASALQRGIRVMPVLLGGATMPEKEQLPDAISELCLYQASELREKDWEYDCKKLIGALVDEDGGRAIKELVELIDQIPEASSERIRSAHAVKTALEQAKELATYKSVHDILHQLEFHIQRPIKENPRGGPLRRTRYQFNEYRANILRELDGREMLYGCEGLVTALKLTADAFKKAEIAGDRLTEDACSALGYELRYLLGCSSFLHGAIAQTEERLRLGDITAGVARILAIINPPDRLQRLDPALERAIKRLSEDLKKLIKIQQELELRVREHARFQALDTLLRAATEAPAASLIMHWEIVKRSRSNLILRSPIQETWSEQTTKTIESDIEAALTQGKYDQARHLLELYSEDVAYAFATVNADLKKFITDLNLREIGPVLDALLSIPEN
jgi:hypothetical protein